ncbi:MAG: type I-B CRISPR-associated endonuclease Cas1b [Candidatus Micrarchaeota archaeon]|nr:type I-B CRISPR-associated endonuclease Cas1b [Candidatus Micrarchaeota archaeon]
MSKKYVIISSGRLKREENTIVFIKDQEKRYLPIEQIEELYIFGRVDFNIDFFEYIGERGIVAHMFDYYGWYKGSFVPKEDMFSGEVVIKQALAAVDPNQSMRLAREFVKGAIYNLARIGIKRGDLELKHKLKQLFDETKNSNHRDELMGIEGNARRIFYEHMRSWIDWEFQGRSRNPPKDQVNALISFLNSLSYASCLKNILKTPLHPGISYLHSNTERNRFSLALDLSEVFKPLFSEALAINLINLRKLDEDRDFEYDDSVGGVFLNEKGRNIVMKSWIETLETTIYHRHLKRYVSYEKLILLEVYKLIKDLINDKKYKSFRVWW